VRSFLREKKKYKTQNDVSPPRWEARDDETTVMMSCFKKGKRSAIEMAP
jgi:hypothetical protein